MSKQSVSTLIDVLTPKDPKLEEKLKEDMTNNLEAISRTIWKKPNHYLKN